MPQCQQRQVLGGGWPSHRIAKIGELHIDTHDDGNRIESRCPLQDPSQSRFRRSHVPLEALDAGGEKLTHANPMGPSNGAMMLSRLLQKISSLFEGTEYNGRFGEIDERRADEVTVAE